LSFFLPSRLIDFEYFETNSDEGYPEEAKPYQRDMDFAFFAVNFGYSKIDYEALTPREAAFIYKAWENKIVSDTTHLRNAVLNAVTNALRKKGKKFSDLWQKKARKVNQEVVNENLEIMKQIEEKEGKAWVEKLYKANGFNGPIVKRKGGEAYGKLSN